MQESITNEAGFEQVIRANGTTTRTASVMRLAVEHRKFDQFDPISGVNHELLAAVRDQITANKAWWDQSHWRQIVDSVGGLANGDSLTLAEQEDSDLAITSAIAFEVDSTAPACGTSMCFAGWAAEIARVDWVVDAKAARRAYKMGPSEVAYLNSGEVTDLLFVPRAEADDNDFDKWHLVENSEWLVEEAHRRGFSPATHAVVPVYSWAKRRLGIGSDPLEMFSGTNTYEQVVTASVAYDLADRPIGEISLYGHYGAQPTWADYIVKAAEKIEADGGEADTSPWVYNYEDED